MHEHNNPNCDCDTTADAATDFGITAHIATGFVGAFFTTPIEFARQDSPRGIQYTEKLRSSTTTYHVAVTADLQADLPTLPQLLRALAHSPSGCVKLYLKPKRLRKFVKKHAKNWVLRFDASVEALCPGTKVALK